MGQGAVTRVAGAAGAACWGIAVLWSGTALGGIAWAFAVLGACLGYGQLLAAACHQRASISALAVSGMAFLLVASTALARAGMLVQTVQQGAIVVGIAACVLLRSQASPRRMSTGTAVFVGLSTFVLLALGVVQDVLLLGDGANHAFAIKRLWDTGELAVHHQAGAQIVGEAYLALATGAQTTQLFDGGVCAALVIALLAEELATRDDGLGPPLFFVLAVPILLHPLPARDDIGLWSTVALTVGTFVALGDALHARRVAWLALPPALAMLLMRHELLPFALPLAGAAVFLPRGERFEQRVLVALVISWSAVLFVMQLGYRASVLTATWRLGVLWFAAPLTLAIMRLARLGSWRSATGTVVFGALTLTLASVSHATSLSFQSPITLAAVWFAAGLCLALRERWSIALVVALIVGFVSIEMNVIDRKRDRVRARFAEPAARLDELKHLGLPVEAHEEIRVLQEHAPRGARIAFWGRSAARLDFERNPIRDVSWPSHRWRTEFFLSTIHPRLVRTVDYVVVENMLGRPVRDPWGFSRARPLDAIADQLEVVAETGRARLYRVRR